MILEIDGVDRQFGPTAAIPGHPIRSPVAAARLAANANESLEAGSIVMAGAATAAEALSPEQHVRLTVQKLGRVESEVARADTKSE